MCNLQDVVSEIKSNLKNAQGCVTDKVVTLLADLGVDNLGISETLGISIRAVQKSRKRSPVADASELQDASQSSPAHGVTNSRTPEANSSSHDVHGIANSRTPTPRAPAGITTRATKDFLRKESYQEVKQEPPLVPQGGKKDDLQPTHERVKFADGRLTLFNGLRQFWLERFDNDADRLDLALIQAAGFVQPHSTRPLEAQVSSQLARSAADKRDRDKRYAAAAKANPRQPKTDKPKAKGMMDLLREQMGAPQ